MSVSYLHPIKNNELDKLNVPRFSLVEIRIREANKIIRVRGKLMGKKEHPEFNAIIYLLENQDFRLDFWKQFRRNWKKYGTNKGRKNNFYPYRTVGKGTDPSAPYRSLFCPAEKLIAIQEEILPRKGGIIHPKDAIVYLSMDCYPEGENLYESDSR